VGQGTLILGLFVIGTAFVVLYAAKVVLKSNELVNSAKEKLMWSPVLRGQIQMYYPTSIKTLTFFSLFMFSAKERYSLYYDKFPKDDEISADSGSKRRL